MSATSSVPKLIAAVNRLAAAFRHPSSRAASNRRAEQFLRLGVLAFIKRLLPPVVVRPPQRLLSTRPGHAPHRHTSHDQHQPEQKPKGGNSRRRWLRGISIKIKRKEHVGNVLHVGYDLIVPDVSWSTFPTCSFPEKQRLRHARKVLTPETPALGLAWCDLLHHDLLARQYPGSGLGRDRTVPPQPRTTTETCGPLG